MGYKGKHIHTITEEDIGCSVIAKRCPVCDGRCNIQIEDAIGPVQSYDVGKMVFLVNGVVCVENQEQLEKRKTADTAI